MNTLTTSKPKSTIQPQGPVAAEVMTEDIRARAYAIYRQRRNSCAAGDAMSDWLQAERELKGQLQAAAGARPRAEALLKGDQE